MKEQPTLLADQKIGNILHLISDPRQCFSLATLPESNLKFGLGIIMMAKTPFHMPNVRERHFGIEQMTSVEDFARPIGMQMGSCLLVELLTALEKFPATDV